MSTKNMWLAIVALAAVLAVVAAFVFVKPDQSDRPQINPPSVEDNVEDQRDEISGDNMTGIGTGDVENTDVGVVTPNPDAAKDEKPDVQKPEQDKTPVDDNKDDEQEKEEEKPPVHEEEDAPAVTPDDEDKTPSDSGSSSSKPNADGSIGTTNVGGSVYRQFPDGYNVNSITPQKPFERVMIGNAEYLWDGGAWVVVDNTPKPNQSTEIGDLTGNIVFH